MSRFEQKRELCVGFDLGRVNSQICCFHPKTGELETIGGSKTDCHYYFIPTVLGVSENRREWFYGEQLNKIKEYEDVFVIEDMVEKIGKGEKIVLPGGEVEGAVLLEKFFRKVLVLLQPYYPNSSIAKLSVAIEKKNDILEQEIYKALANMGIDHERVDVISHETAFVYYALSQKQDLWEKNAALFHYDTRGLRFTKLLLNKNQRPIVADSKEIDLSKEFGYEQYEKLEKKELTERLYKVAEQALWGMEAGTLYFSGEGFLSNWSDKALERLCFGRRGFRGPNIYVRGAAFYARNAKEQKFKQSFLYLEKGLLRKSISLKLYHDGKIDDYEVLPAGISWQDAKNEFSILFDKEEEIPLLIKDVMEETQTLRIISLDGMPKRPEKMGRFDLSFCYEDENTCFITVRDQGFGELEKKTGRVWEKHLKL